MSRISHLFGSFFYLKQSFLKNRITIKFHTITTKGTENIIIQRHELSARTYIVHFIDKQYDCLYQKNKTKRILQKFH